MCLCLRHHKIHPPHPRYGDYEPTVYYATGRRRHVGFHTSGTEILHLLAAVVVLTIGFGLFMAGLRIYGNVTPLFGLAGTSLPDIFLAAGIATGSGFILHELMHKFVAQYYGHWAEFRGQLWGLAIAIPLPYLTGWIFAAPGAVMISGFVKKHENGIISAAGPAMNLIIAGIALPFTLQAGSVDSIGHKIAYVALAVNAFLAAFNMLPFGPLDGKKVWAWNKGVYALIMATAIYLIYVSWR